MARAPLLLSSLLLAASACSSTSADAPGSSSEDPDAGATTDAGGTSTTGDAASTPGNDGGPAALGEVHFKIKVDYRYDTAGFFADPVRRKALDGACRIWGRLLTDDFAKIPKGTYIKVRDPQKPTEPAVAFEYEDEIDDLLVFVGSSDLPPGVTGLSSPTAGLSGITDPTLAASLQKRFDEAPFQPWTAWISFDSGTDFFFDPEPDLGHPVPSGKLDFASVALHELGHTLGFGTAAAFKSKIAGDTFTGAKATALFGGPLPLTPDHGHVPNTTLSGGQRMLMDASDAAGTRYLPTPLDKAVFEDLGLHF